MRLRVIDDSPLDLSLVVDAMQVELAQRARRHQEVDVRIVERRQDRRAARIDDAISGQAARSDAGDALTVNDNRVRVGSLPYLAVHDRQGCHQATMFGHGEAGDRPGV